MRKALFLDIDGVLNNRETILRTGGTREWDQRCVDALNRITSLTGAEIVVSSTWRWGRSPCELRGILQDQGVNGTMRGVTPKINDDERWIEIQAWIDDSAKFGKPVDKFVVLDDSDMGPMNDKTVRTDAAIGLTEADADKAIAMLGRE